MDGCEYPRRGVVRAATNTRLVARVTLLALVAVGVAASSVVAASGAAGRPTLAANKHVAHLTAVPWGKSITLSGKATLGGRQTVVLQAQLFPFTKPFKTIAHQITTTGSYSFTVKPSIATHYRIQVGSQTSRVLTAYVFERWLNSYCNLCNGSSPGSSTLILSGVFESPRSERARSGPTALVYLYYAIDKTSTRVPSTLHLVETAPLHIHGRRLSYTVRYPVSFPAGGHSNAAWQTCTKDIESKTGVGLPGYHHCGAKTISRKAPYLG